MNKAFENMDKVVNEFMDNLPKKTSINNYIIQGKGYWNVQTNDPFISGVQTTDIQSSYNHIAFKGTEKQLDSFLSQLIEQGEAQFKVIGIHEIN
tara:strand:- start:423 stop:704 length:282 start_codon:yes stop_codon:yes gene_type:complete